MTKYFVKFPDAADRVDSMPMLMADEERLQPYVPSAAPEAERIVIADLSAEEADAARAGGAELFEDVQFQPFGDLFRVVPQAAEYWRESGAAPGVGGTPATWHTADVNDVMQHNRAAAAWALSRGRGVTIGIIDTGIAGSMPEFPAARQSPLSKTYTYRSPWSDPKGHGSMCACAAASSKDAGGRYDGVAPEAMLMSLKSSLASTDIYMLYDWVISKKRAGAFPGPVVLSNSYGLYRCSSPGGLPDNHPYFDIVKLAVSEGIPVIFAAGNNHVTVCGADPTQCSPNSIWGPNSADEVLSVGTVDWDERMDRGKHADSSRGPGEWARQHPKPDCVAPTYGEIIWSSGYRRMEWWGTSGACPQAAGLAALLLQKNPALTPHQVYDAIRQSCRDLGLARDCQGAGMIDCAAALGYV